MINCFGLARRKGALIMSKAFDFIKECGTYFVLTVDGTRPMGRPFGAIMEIGETLYISTDDTKAVYRQMKANPQIQLFAIRADRCWARISGIAQECAGEEIKNLMWDACPSLHRQISGPDAPHFTVFSVSVTEADIHD